MIGRSVVRSLDFPCEVIAFPRNFPCRHPPQTVDSGPSRAVGSGTHAPLLLAGWRSGSCGVPCAICGTRFIYIKGIDRWRRWPRTNAGPVSLWSVEQTPAACHGAMDVRGIQNVRVHNTHSPSFCISSTTTATRTTNTNGIDPRKRFCSQVIESFNFVTISSVFVAVHLRSFEMRSLWVLFLVLHLAWTPRGSGVCNKSHLELQHGQVLNGSNFDMVSVRYNKEFQRCAPCQQKPLISTLVTSSG